MEKGIVYASIAQLTVNSLGCLGEKLRAHYSKIFLPPVQCPLLPLAPDFNYFTVYPSFVTLRKQKSNATFKTMTGIRFVALFSNMMDTIIALD